MNTTVSSAFERLAEPVKQWVWQQRWNELRDIQEQAIPAILDGGDVILAARTAAGKTEAAFLPLVSRILPRMDGGQPGFAVVYVSPLKALINDQFRRLESLLETCNVPLHRWHGDVSSDARRRAIERPQGIVLITPESLEATLVRRGREAERLFGRLDAIVIDELHAFIGTERGRQLQSILTRIEVAAKRDRIDRVGLSATLGDMALARDELRPGGGDTVNVINSEDGEQELLLQVRGYTWRRPQTEEEAAQPSQADTAMAEHLFRVLRGKRNLLFGGSRRNVEIFSDRLRSMSDEGKLPNEFFAHHGNLAKSEREMVESRLRDDPRPTTAVATSTLELGIDIGDVESVAQIGAGWSVASLRQRLGRSGRRAGQPAVLRMYIAEEQFDASLHVSDRLRLHLIQAIAMVQLLIERWCEPPQRSGLHLSTLLHQVLAVICQFGALAPETVYKLLCLRGPFRAVDQKLFADLLRSMAQPDIALLEMAPDRTLMLGKTGERIASGHEFYAVFMTPEEYRVIANGKTLGTVPVDKTLVPGQTIIFSGKRWRILKVEVRARLIEVQAAPSALPPRFGGDLSGVHDRIAAQMKHILQGTDVPAFIDNTARGLLAEARDAFVSLGLDRKAILQIGTGCIILPWVGSIKLETLALALMECGFEASPEGHTIEVSNCEASSLLEVLHELARSAPVEGHVLADHAAKLYREKYDSFLPDELLKIALAVEKLDPGSVPAVARQIAGT
ncbi:MAG: DEAD/DEAH box helicase [Xanthobacteraceae bacterium]|nr:DEAD/DEAH box helicase [Xanthobacteraceae bacterium]